MTAVEHAQLHLFIRQHITNQFGSRFFPFRTSGNKVILDHPLTERFAGHPGRVARGSLDLLVIDEAGQFSLASTIAVSAAAQRLLLLGDPQQLPQVSQGTHPEPVDESALSWLVEGRHTLPAERGYFLDVSYRMHPAG